MGTYKKTNSSIDVAPASMLRDKFVENIIGIPNTSNEAREFMYGYIHILPAPPESIT
jgi:hypothetical protein